MSNNKGSKMGVGFIFGIVLGALGGIFLAPKSGKENREAVATKLGDMKDMIESGEMEDKIREVFGDLSDESVKMYTTARDYVLDTVENMKNMTGEDYANAVQDAVDKVKSGTKVSADKMNKLKDQLVKDWPYMKREAEKKTRKAAKTVSKKTED